MMMFWSHIFSAAALGVASLSGISAIDTVDKLIVDKYLGRWYQAYGNAVTARTITRDSTCIAADYGLDEATGNITVINSDREHIPTGELNTITGYAYGVDQSKPGQLKVHLGQVPVDGDYWIVGLGPATFGPKKAYQWAIVSGPEAESLFILVRDVRAFEKKYAKDVLALVKDLGFTGPEKEPRRIPQRGCIPFDPMTITPGKMKMTGWSDILESLEGEDTQDAEGMAEYIMMLEDQPSNEETGDLEWNPLQKPVETVTKLDVERYGGRWYQAYSSLTVMKLLEQNGACVTADYAKQADGTVSVVNTARKNGVDGDLIEMDGYAYYKDESEPGKLTVHLNGLSMDAPYWVVALGDEDGDGDYPWSIVSDPLRAFLFVLVRDPETFFGSQDETDLLAKCKEMGFTSFWNTPQKTVQEGCEYPSTPAEGDEEWLGMAGQLDSSSQEMTEWVDLMLNSLEVEGTQDVWGIEEYIIKQVEPLRKPVETVTKLDVERYGGRWYQAYSSLTVMKLLEQNGACVTADYAKQADGTVSVVNTARKNGVDGDLIEMDGYAYYEDESEPGKLTVHLNGLSMDAPYWVVALGDEDGDGDYPWSIVSDPLRAFLFVLVRDPETFFGSQDETDLLAKCKEMGFTSFWNTPQKTVQEGCEYPSTPAEGDEEWLGMAGPLDASFKEMMGWDFMSMSLEDEGTQDAEGMAEYIMKQVGQLSNEETGDLEWEPLRKPVETVTKLDVERYGGRWYQAYSSLTVMKLLEQNGACVTADYAKQADGTVSVVNTARKNGVDGDLIEMDGYAYYKDESEPGKLTVHLNGLSMDAPYWVVALGDEDGDGDYPWSIVSDPLRAFLFVLVRDPETFFGSQDETDLLAKCKEMGFTSFWNTPQKTVQEGCEYPSTPAEGIEEPSSKLSPEFSLLRRLRMAEPLDASSKEMTGWDFMSMSLEDEGTQDAEGMEEYIMKQVGQLINEETGDLEWEPLQTPVETVTKLDVERYGGRWYQAYSSLTVMKLLEQNGACVTADYAKQADGTVSVVNTARKNGVDGDLIEMDGYAYYKDESEPGKLTVHLNGLSMDAPYWVVALGDEDGEGDYPWSIVSDPLRAFLFVLVRDPETFFGSQDETDLLAKCKEMGFTSFWNTPQKTVQEGCEYPSKGMTELFYYMFETLEGEDTQDAEGIEEYLMEQVGQPINEETGYLEWEPLQKPVGTVTKLDVERYGGRWYQAYSSLTVMKLLEQNGACVTADYAKQADGTVSVVNTARKNGVDGDLITMDGYAYYKDKSEPGKLTVHLNGLPLDAPYWVVALGDEDGDGDYPWSIVSDPLRAFLFVLVRDSETFFGSQAETDVLAKCKEMGFTSFWNTPQKTVQEGCEYPSTPAEGNEKPSSKLSPRFNLRRRLGVVAGPLHASCKMTVKFPEDTCEAVMDALVSSAKSMMGFDKCNGGNKCGYTVSKVDQDSVALVHETSKLHYKDDLSFTVTSKGESCQVSAFSTSQTWYAVLDNSVNYCNLHNLVEASGLEFQEVGVSDETCTQYSSADCERY